MSFLGLFKSKEEKAMEKIFDGIYARAFPGGKQQIEDDTDEVSKMFDGKYNRNLIKDSYVNVATRFYTFEDKSEERIVGSMMIRMGGAISREDIVRIYNFVKNRFLKQNLGIEDEDMLASLSEGLFGGQEGCDTDEIPGGIGEFGHDKTNPIPTNGIAGSRTYLDSLRSLTETRGITWGRIGPCSADNIEEVIDEYKIFSVGGEPIATIYISPYHRRNSEKAPAGFEFV